jgi:hypothetical protein
MNFRSARSNYGAAALYLKIVQIVGLVLILFGIFLSINGYGNMARMLPGIGMVTVGFFSLVAAQLMCAVIDNADQTREILELLKSKI